MPAITPMTDDAAMAVGYLLAFAADVDSDAPGDAAVIRRTADAVVTNGIAGGVGFINGAWYAIGNTCSPRHPFGLNATWKGCLTILTTINGGC